jgi:hypothetical protein
MIGRIKDNAGEATRQLIRIPTRPIVHSIARPVVPYLSKPYTNVGPFFDEAATEFILWSGFDNVFPVNISCPQAGVLADVYVIGQRFADNPSSILFNYLIEDDPFYLEIPPDTWVQFYATSTNTINVQISMSSGVQLFGNTSINPTFELQIIGSGP